MSSLPASTTPGLPAAPPSLGPTLGGIELGILFAFLLTGITVVQLFMYYQADFKKDSVLVKLAILFVFAFELLHDGLIAGYLYHTTITGFGNYNNLATVHWTLGWSIAIGSVASGTVQAFFGWRIWCLSNQRWVAVLSWSGAVARICLSFAVSILASGKLTVDFNNQFRWLEGLTVTVGMCNDIVNTGGLTYILWKSKGKMVRSRKIVEKLIIWTVETGALTTVMSTLALLLLFLSPETPAFLSVSMIFAKLYSNSLLASLNGRVALRSTGNETTVSFMSDAVTVAFAPRTTDTVSRAEIFVEMTTSSALEGGLGTKDTAPDDDSRRGISKVK